MNGLTKLNKTNDLLVSSSIADYDIILISETWLDSSIKDCEYIHNNYNVYRKDREKSEVKAKKGGGVLIAVKKLISSEICETNEMKPLEMICVKIPTSAGNIFIFNLYIQPPSSTSIDNFGEVSMKHINAIKSLSINTSDSILIFGDFNLNNIQWCENESGFDFIPFVGESEGRPATIAKAITSEFLQMGLFQMCDIQNDWNNVLDLVYTNVPELVVVDNADFPLLPIQKIDKAHRPLQCSVECTPIAFESSDAAKPIYCFKKANYIEIRELIATSNLNYLIKQNGDDVNGMLKVFYEFIYEVFEKCVPKSSLRMSSKPIWHDTQLSHLKNVRNREFNKLCANKAKSPNADNKSFLEAREAFEKYKSDLYNEYVKEIANSAKQNPKKFWKFINDKRKQNSLPIKMKSDTDIATTDTEKANMFAKFFSSVYQTHTDDNYDFIDNRNDNGFHRIVLTHECVFAALSTMDRNKGAGFDGVSSIFLRECAESLSMPLSIIFSTSMKLGIYPDKLKIGQVTPIYKSGCKSSVYNYRGVNVLPNVAKVFEKAVYNQLKIIIFPRISQSQHGFVSSRNIDTNLMQLTTDIHKAFEEKAQLDVFYADIAKAFDAVIAFLLIKMCSKFPVANELLRWLVDYLKNRKQYVKIGQSLSELFDVTSGVGQGTILGPLLFLMFFNDSDHILPDINYYNFADDKKISNLVKSESDAMKLQSAINIFFNWCSENKLNVNKSKCKIMSFSLKRQVLKFDYQLDGQLIERVNEIRDLGVIFDPKLNFNKHIEIMINKACAILQFIKRQSVNLKPEIIKILYTALVRSILEFGCSSWSPHHKVWVNLVESVQRKLIMFLNGDTVNRSENGYVLAPYIDRCEKFDFDTLARRRVNSIVLFMHSILSGKIKSDSLRSQINLFDGRISLRNPEFIRVKKCKTDHSQYSSFNNACFMFNHAALFIEPSLPSDEFRKQLMKLPDSAFGPWTKL